MIHLVRRNPPTRAQNILMRLGAVAAALCCSALVISLLGYHPVDVVVNMAAGSAGTPMRIQDTIHKAIPLATLSLGVAVAFKMKFWNIGAEGQFYLGAVFASWAAFFLRGLPAAVLLPLMLALSLLGGALWALIPAVLKTRYQASEILVTLMMNYIAVKFVTYLQYGPWKDPGAKGFAKMPKFPAQAVLPRISGVHVGWILVLAATIFVHILLTRTKFGYKMAVVGASENTARYAGIPVSKVTLTAVCIGGAVCGMAGFLQASGIERSLTDGLSAGLGFTAVITAWLARLSAPGILAVSALFAAMLQGSVYIQSSMQVPAAVADVMQGLLLFFLLGSDFFLTFKPVWRGNRRGAAEREGA